MWGSRIKNLYHRYGNVQVVQGVYLWYFDIT